jgi:PAS domain S-box-containing protein
MPEFEIEAVSDGVQALRSIRNRPPDLVLADVKMPELDGFELLKELRGDPRTQAIPVIMLSARAGEEAQIEGLPAGADDYLVKPFNARELLARVRVNLELAQLREKLSREEEKRRGADDMERQWRLFDTALSHSAEALLIFDRERRFIYANQVLLQRVRKPLAEVLGKTLLDVGYPPHIDAQQAEEFARVLQECVPLRSKFSMVDAAGKERHYDYFMVPVLSNGAVEAIAVTSWDVTQFIETNRELREANADLEQFAYSASHDLKSPLRVIANASKWLEEDLRPHLTPETREHIDLLRGRVVRMDKLLDDLLAYARIGRTPDKWKLQTIMGDALLNDVLALLPCEGFQVIISPAFAQIRLCRMPLSQVLMNLIDNAIKHHGGKTGRIEITVEDRGARYEFAVKDDGPGIAPEFHERIFKLFQTLKPKDQVEGAGMGLALVRKWVELFGGTIRVDSTDGEGSAFRFTWPKEQSRGLTK